MKNHKINLFLVAGFCSIIFVLLRSVEKIPVKNFIWIEAESCEDISLPLEVTKMEGSSEGSGVQSTGGHHNTSGNALYKFQIPNDAKYFLWARCYWPHVCANSFSFSINNGTLFKIGENPIVNQWHWILGPIYNLQKGNQDLRLWNSETDSRIDKFLLTTDPYFIPSGDGNSNNYFFDFNDGKLPEAITFSEKEDWNVILEPETNNGYLIPKQTGNSIEKRVFIPTSSLSDYVFRTAFKLNTRENNKLRFYFIYQNDSNNYQVVLNSSHLILNKIENGKKKVLWTESQSSFIKDSVFNDIACLKKGELVRIKLNGKLFYQLQSDTLASDYVGIGAEFTDIVFDNIAVSKEENTAFNENFHYTEFSTTIIRPEVSQDYFKSIKSKTTNGWMLSGNWNNGADNFETLKGKADTNIPGLILFGNDFGQDYSFTTAVNLSNDNGAGICFRFQDTNNYYLFKWEKVIDEWFYKLLKYENGKPIDLAGKKCIMHPKTGFANWYKLEVRSKADSIGVFIDENPIFSITDNSFSDGKTGLWTSSLRGTEFDDIVYKPISQVELEPETRREYTFASNRQIALDMSDWDFSPENKSQPLRFNKQLFDETLLYNKHFYPNNFTLNLELPYIPKDVDVKLSITGYVGEVQNRYSFTIREKYIEIIRDGEIQLQKEVPNLDRNTISLLHKGYKWQLRIGTKKGFYEDSEEFQFDKVTIGIGLSGVGVASLQMPHITITAN